MGYPVAGYRTADARAKGAAGFHSSPSSGADFERDWLRRQPFRPTDPGFSRDFERLMKQPFKPFDSKYSFTPRTFPSAPWGPRPKPLPWAPRMRNPVGFFGELALLAFNEEWNKYVSDPHPQGGMAPGPGWEKFCQGGGIPNFFTPMWPAYPSQGGTCNVVAAIQPGAQWGDAYQGATGPDYFPMANPKGWYQSWVAQLDKKELQSSEVFYGESQWYNPAGEDEEPGPSRVPVGPLPEAPPPLVERDRNPKTLPFPRPPLPPDNRGKDLEEGKPKPPGRKTKEKKTKLSRRWRLIVMSLNFFTEVTDTIDAIYYALPKDLRKKLFRENGGFLNFAQKGEAVYRNWSKLDPVKAIENIVTQQIGDFIAGSVGRLSQKQRRELFEKYGFETGWTASQFLNRFTKMEESGMKEMFSDVAELTGQLPEWSAYMWTF